MAGSISRSAPRNSATALARCTSRSQPRCSAPCRRISGYESDTDAVDHDTGAYGSTGTVAAGTATLRAAEALRTLMLERGAALLAVPAPGVTLTLDGAVAGHHRVTIDQALLCAEALAFVSLPLGADPNIPVNRHSAPLVSMSACDSRYDCRGFMSTRFSKLTEAE
jgi:hypothetical protein